MDVILIIMSMCLCSHDDFENGEMYLSSVTLIFTLC